MLVRRNLAFGAFDPARQRQSHPGQARGSVRKRLAQVARRAERLAEAVKKGISVVEVIRRRQGQVTQAVVQAGITAKKKAQQLAAEQAARQKVQTGDIGRYW